MLLQFISVSAQLPGRLLLLQIAGGSNGSPSLITNQNLLIVVVVFSIALISLVVAYRSRNAAYNLARKQQERLQKLNEQLRSQSEELTQANQAKDQLISVISHDLRAPLASLDSCLEIMLTEDLSSEEKDELIRDLQKETYNTLKTLDDLLAWARLQQQGGKFTEEPFNLVQLIQEIKGLYNPVARHKAVELVFESKDHAIYSLGDPNQIRTVLRNLVSNAIKFSPENGRVNIELKTSASSVEISVTDEGKGISNEELLKIKDPEIFYSSQGTAGENGTGVGLMLSFEFIDRHKSELRLQPANPKGTKASFQLRIADSEKPVKSA